MKHILSFNNALLLCITSVFGVIILLILGACYGAQVVEFKESKHIPPSFSDTANNCYTAAGIYAVLFVLSYIQLMLHNREQ